MAHTAADTAQTDFYHEPFLKMRMVNQQQHASAMTALELITITMKNTEGTSHVSDVVFHSPTLLHMYVLWSTELRHAAKEATRIRRGSTRRLCSGEWSGAATSRSPCQLEESCLPVVGISVETDGACCDARTLIPESSLWSCAIEHRVVDSKRLAHYHTTDERAVHRSPTPA